MQQQSKQQILNNEQLLHTSEGRQPTVLNRLLANDFLEIGQSGQLFRKQYCTRQLSNEAAFTIVMTNIELKELHPETVLLIYKAKKTNLTTNEISYSLRSSLWRKHNENWQLFFHQGTPINES